MILRVRSGSWVWFLVLCLLNFSCAPSAGDSTAGAGERKSVQKCFWGEEKLQFSFTFFGRALVVSVIGAVVVVAKEVVVASVGEKAPFMQLSTGKPSISGKLFAGRGKEPEW